MVIFSALCRLTCDWLVVSGESAEAGKDLPNPKSLVTFSNDPAGIGTWALITNYKRELYP